ncbi:MAG TPA: Gfo/Idh/MocA family oxidoreductase [Candidatus Eisenbacteria bacterium]|nr:Gfo/Idh/MocA family oxidoreductase [Candidatus Eisenbacteria bacterium]
MAKKKRIGFIGCGQWGPNHIRTFFFNPGTQVVRICDTNPARLKAIQPLYPGVQSTRDWREITRAKDLDAVVVATPVSSHFEIASDALEHGKDVLCEKPLTLKTFEAEALTQLADRRKRILMVGHVFLFNQGILKLKELLDQKTVGRNYYFHAKRTNLGPVRRDANAVYDLASHDISIFNFLMGAEPTVLSAVGKCYLQKGVEDVSFVSLEYPGGVLAHVHVSWLDPLKVRQITVVGSEKMITWDDLSQTAAVGIYSKRVQADEKFYRDFGEFNLLVKDGEVLIPSIKHVEPLKQQADHFVECIVKRRRPVSDGRFAAGVVRTLETIEGLLDASRR